MTDDCCAKCGDAFHGATELAGRLVMGRLLCPLCIQKVRAANVTRN